MAAAIAQLEQKYVHNTHIHAVGGVGNGAASGRKWETGVRYSRYVHDRTLDDFNTIV